MPLRAAEYLGLLSSHHVRAIVNSLFPAARGAATSLAASDGGAGSAGLLEAPADQEEFRALVTQLVVSPSLRRLLGV